MRVGLLLIVGVLLCTGCRVNPRAEREIALLRAEILDLEDQYYSLKSRCESDGCTTTEGGYFNSTIIDGDCVDCEPSSIIQEAAPGSTGNGNQGIEEIESIESVIEDPTVSEGDSTSVIRIVPHEDEKLPRRRNADPRAPSNHRIATVDINRRISKAVDLDGIPGHEGLTLLIQPKDHSGRVRKIPGRIHVSVTEPMRRSQHRPIGNWQFTAEESKNFLVKDQLVQQGFLIHLPWDKAIPQSDRVNVSVRFFSGRNVTVANNHTIEVVPPPEGYSLNDPLIANWIENDARWMGNSADDLGFVTIVEAPVENKNESKQNESTAIQDRVSAPGWRPVR